MTETGSEVADSGPPVAAAGRLFSPLPSLRIPLRRIPLRIVMTVPFGESCAACHGPDAGFAVDKVHAR